MGKWNAALTITRALYHPGACLDGSPDAVEILVDMTDPPHWREVLILQLSELSTTCLTAKVPWLQFAGEGKPNSLSSKLIADLTEGIGAGSIPKAFLFDQMGVQTLPSGRPCFLRGSKMIGDVGREFEVAPSLQHIWLKEASLSASQVGYVIRNTSWRALIAILFTLLSSIRSLILGAGIDLQAVLFIFGKQGTGKTTLAKRTGATHRTADGSDYAMVQAGSTPASIHDIMIEARDCSLIVDDLCKSASQKEVQRRLDLVCELIRLAGNDSPITKKKGRSTVARFCQSGMVFTGEFIPQNRSDVTRCIPIHLQSTISLSDDLTPGAVGDAVVILSKWLTIHCDEFIAKLRNAVGTSFLDLEDRLRTSYACLNTVADEFVCALQASGVASATCISIRRKAEKAIRKTIGEHLQLLEKLDAHEKVGNLPYIILQGIKQGAFGDESKPKKLGKKVPAVITDTYLDVIPDTLEQFVRAQPGYENYTKWKISRDLKQIGALVIHGNGEHSENTIRPRPDGPKIYRLILEVLKDEQEIY